MVELEIIVPGIKILAGKLKLGDLLGLKIPASELKLSARLQPPTVISITGIRQQPTCRD